MKYLLRRKEVTLASLHQLGQTCMGSQLMKTNLHQFCQLSELDSQPLNREYQYRSTCTAAAGLCWPGPILELATVSCMYLKHPVSPSSL